MGLDLPRLTALPKAELHVHLEGSVSADLAARMAERNSVAVPPRPPEGGFSDFASFIASYLAISSCFATAEDFAEATAELARREATQGVVWAEVTFTPMTHVVRGGLDEALVAEGLVEGRRRAAEAGVGIGWVFDVVRGFDDQAHPTLDFMRRVEKADPGSVVAIGLGGPEASAPSVDGVESAFEAAKADGFKSVPHAGELVGPSSVWDAVRRLRADRIGHGIRCLEDPQLVHRLVEGGTVLEVCPTSNVRLGVTPSLAEHPLPELLRAGLHVTLATDDPALFGQNLVDEYAECADAFGWTPRRVESLVRASIRHSFMPSRAKTEWLAKVDQLTDESASPAR